MVKKMFQTVTILCIFFYLVMQLLLMNVRGELIELIDDSDNTTEWDSGELKRPKRSPSSPYILKFRVKYAEGEYISLIWFQQNSFLANENLPIVLPIGNVYETVMKNIGEFVVYHDDLECSAIVHYKKSNTLSGFIGLDYIIMNLPYEFNQDGNYIGKGAERYISKRPYPQLHELPPIPDTFLEEVLPPATEDTAAASADQPSTSEGLRFGRDMNRYTHEELGKSTEFKVNHRSRRWNPLQENYYLEILVIITSGVVEKYEEFFGNDKYIEPLVKDYINYFNAVDMMFRKLHLNYYGLFINIAEIVIEDRTTSLDTLNDGGELKFIETIQKRRWYLQAHQDFYPKDSFDYVFISTSHPIRHDSSVVPGKTDMLDDLYAARKIGQWYNAVPITIQSFMNDYSLAVHEIGRILHLEEDPWDEGFQIFGQCYAIMQRGSSKCCKCLKWSTRSREQSAAFFGRNIDRCFLLNEPRSLRPLGPSVFLTPYQQCQCYGFSSSMLVGTGDVKSYISSKECDMPLKCRTAFQVCSPYEFTIKPIDGTKCGGSNNKVCWDRKCRFRNSHTCPSTSNARP